MPQFLQVRNWTKFQHYKDRCPPWIKTYTDLLQDYTFLDLGDAARGHLFMIWLLASRTDNKLPNDPAWVQKRIGSKSKPDLELLISLGYLEQHASSVLAPAEESRDRVETEKSREESSAEAQTPKPVFALRCTSGAFEVSSALYDQWLTAYPGVDVLLELVRAQAWQDSNPTKRKTVKGAARFLNSWLAKNQDRGSPGNITRPAFGKLAALEAAGRKFLEEP